MVALSMLDHHHHNNRHHETTAAADQQQQAISTSSAVAEQEQEQQQQQQQQLYFAQLLAAQQQAAIAMAEKGGGEEEGDGSGGEKNAREERERREREGSERNTNLIINYLPQNMTQEEVRALFSSMGEVESCKLIRDKATGQSLGYAFVNYERPADARKALASMGGLRLQNKVLKVSLARPSKDDIKGANLYVSGLPKSLTHHELEAAFRPFGSIITSRILSDNVTGLSKGVGFVRFDRKCEADYAIEKMSGTSPWGGEETITVKFANSPSANTAKSTAIQVAQAMLPLQMLQSVASSSAPASVALSALPVGTPLLQSLSSVTSPTQQTVAVAGGPIHAHTPQHRFRYSPLAGAPLISAASMLPSATVTSSPASVHALSSLNPTLLTASSAQSCCTAPTSFAQFGPDYYAAAALQQQLFQQQLNVYNQSLIAANPAAALNVAAATQQQQQQQYAAYAAMVAAAAATANSCAFVGQQNGGGDGATAAGAGGGWTLAVHNLGSEVGEPSLWRMFGPFGAVLSVKISKGKGQATITMANYEEAAAAVNSLNGTLLGGRTLQIGLKHCSQ